MTAPVGPPIGRLNGIHAEPGTILGPDDTGRYYVVQADDTGVDIRFSTGEDLPGPVPRSLAEHRLLRYLNPFTG